MLSLSMPKFRPSAAQGPIFQKMSKFPPAHIHQKISKDVGKVSNIALLTVVLLDDGKVQIL